MTLLLLQMALVLAVTLACGCVARQLGQSRVIGEILGGIALGPSLFGRFAPHTAAAIFPQSSLVPFDTLSNVGLILFLFVIGTELNVSTLRRHKTTATLASTMSMLLPFGMAVALAPALRTHFAPAGVPALPFTLLLGVAMSITAFPVLARILDERRMQGTSLGSTALLCAAVDDVCAWTLLAIALTLLPHAGQAHSVAWNLLWLGLYIVAMIAVVRPLMAALARRWQSSITLSYEMLGVVVVLLLLSAAATDAIGVHPLFGAFLAGLCFPRVPQWQAGIRSRLEMVVSVLLLPFFFALTGMRTRLDLLGGGEAWLWTGVILAVAIVGKIGGATLGVRLTGGTWRDGLGLGSLLNTRGLVELIVLNIAYKAGIFSPQLFSMMVVMALVTTMMTTPLLNALKIHGEADPALRRHGAKAALLLILLLPSLLHGAQAVAQTKTAEPLVAIDVLLEADPAMVARAKAVNARLREAYPRSYALDAAHTPHITLVQRYVPASKLPEVKAAIARVVDEQHLEAMRLTTTGYIIGGWDGTAIVLYKVELTDALRSLEEAVDRAVQPYAATDGTEDAFVRPQGGSISQQTVRWVAEFIPAHSGAHYDPHITLGLTTPEFAAILKAEPFPPIAFAPASLSIYQLGDVGTAQKKLAGWPITQR